MSGIFIFLLIFNMLFSTFSYALTQFPSGETYIDYNIQIDKEKLLDYGVTFVNASSVNVTFGGDYQYFEYNDKEYRVKWIDGALTADYVTVQKKTWLGEKLDSWLFVSDVSLTLIDEGITLNALYNGTIVGYWNNQTQWLRINLDRGVIGFITTLAADYPNITKAIYETGEFTFTVGETDQALSFDVFEFVDWYTAMLTGINYSGLPSVFNWVFRSLLTLNVVVGVFAIRDLTKV